MIHSESLLEDDEICKRVIIITAIDERILKNAIKIKYDSLIKNSATQFKNKSIKESVSIKELISEYLDKAFISAIKLGGLSKIQREEYLNELLKQEVDETTLGEAKKIKEEQNFSDETKEMDLHPSATEKLSEDNFFKEMREAIKEKETIHEQMGESYDLAIRDGDFVVKDGDYAREDSKGNVFSNLEIENNIQERLTRQNKIEKLTPSEILLIHEIVQNWIGSTPRKIRIFYYRYLLCKNLLISKYSLLKNRINIWQDEKGNKFLMSLILGYSKSHEPEKISEEKIKVLSSSEREKTVLSGNESIRIYREDYFYLLEILELVIAY